MGNGNTRAASPHRPKPRPARPGRATFSCRASSFREGRAYHRWARAWVTMLARHAHRGGDALDWQAIGLSLRLSLATTAVLFVIGLPLARWLAFTTWRGRFLVEAVVALPLVLPPTVLGFYVLVAFSPRSPLGHAYLSLTGSTLPFTFTGLLLASVLYSLPFAVQPFVAAFSAVDRRLVEASWSLGVSRTATFYRVVLPLSRAGVVTGVVLMVGGNLPGVTRTVSISIYDQVQALDYAAATATAGFLLAVSFIVL